MHVEDFNEDRRPTRGQWEQIARGFCRAAGEPEPTTRLAATELLLRLRAADPPDTTPEGPGAAQTGRTAPESTVSAAAAPVGRVSIGRGGARR
jgi:hypothetical protein